MIRGGVSTPMVSTPVRGGWLRPLPGKTCIVTRRGFLQKLFPVGSYDFMIFNFMFVLFLYSIGILSIWVWCSYYGIHMYLLLTETRLKISLLSNPSGMLRLRQRQGITSLLSLRLKRCQLIHQRHSWRQWVSLTDIRSDLREKQMLPFPGSPPWTNCHKLKATLFEPRVASKLA